MTAVVRRPQQTDFAELKRRIKQAGLLDRQPRYYTLKILLTFSAFFLSLASIVLIHTPWIQYLNAVVLAFLLTQVAFIAHDAGHHAILRGGRLNDAFCIFILNFLLGGSAAWWVGKHNAHHTNPNHVDLDPDMNLPVVAFSPEQVLTKRGFLRFMVKYQAFFFLPLLSFEYYSLRVISLKSLLLERTRYRVVEAVITALHYPLFFGLIFSQLGFTTGVIFILIHQGLAGLYMGLSFAPNHKGMPTLNGEDDLDFVRRQVTTARNLRRDRVCDYFFGPLAVQIEHHLFPNMPTNNGRKAELIVKDFCRERSIPYYETGFFQAYREILLHLHHVSAPLRQAA